PSSEVGLLPTSRWRGCRGLRDWSKAVFGKPCRGGSPGRGQEPADRFVTAARARALKGELDVINNPFDFALAVAMAAPRVARHSALPILLGRRAGRPGRLPIHPSGTRLA